jgi:hypothetical protein
MQSDNHVDLASQRRNQGQRGDSTVRSGGKWSTLLLLAAVLFLGLIVRYPTGAHLHEAGADGSYYAALTHLVTAFGRAPWTASPLSYFGLFPYSEGAAVPLLVAQFESLAGLPEGLSVVLATDLVALVGSLGVFLCILRTTRSEERRVGKECS